MPISRSATRSAGKFGHNPKYAPPSEDYDPATTRYIRAGASGSNNGTDWTNAYTSIPASLTRGYTYFIADGSYGAYTFDDAVDGTKVITLKKATAASHGTSTGWDAAYGDGQAVFSGTFIVNTDYITIDGATRNESNWADGSSYGFRASGVRSSTGDAGVCAAYLTVRYCDFGGTEGTTYTGSEPGDTVYCGGFAENGSNWTIERCYHHNIASYTFFQFAGINGFTVQYNHIRNGFGKEAIRGQNVCKNGVIRWNQFYNASGATGLPGEGSTAEIAIWDGNTNGFDNVEIYGNWFYRTRDENSGGTIVVGGNGGSWAGPPANNCKVYNNTIAGISGSSVGGNILINGGTGNECRNNLWWDTAGSTANPNTSNNVDAGSDPFVDYATGNLHLSGPTSAGYSLGSPYNVDMDGVTRSTPDVGAYEYP